MKLPDFLKKEPPMDQNNGLAAPSSETSLEALRRQILNRIFIVASIMGAAAYLLNLPLVLRDSNWALLGVYTLLLVSLFTIAFLRRIPYNLRAGVIVTLLFLLGLSALLADGLYGSGRVFLISLPIIASILLGLRSQRLARAAGIGSILVVGLLMLLGVIHAPVITPSTSNDSLLSWAVASINFTFLALVTAVSLGILLRGLENSLSKQQNLTREMIQERSQLETRVQQRTQDLERRLLQIRTAAEITRTTSSVLEINELLPQICELMRERFDLYYVGVFLVASQFDGPNGEKRYARLAAGSGEAGQAMLAEGHRLEVGGDSMIGWAVANRRARIALDIGQEAVRFNNPHLPLTRSELALPIISQQEVLGAISVQSEKEAAFDEDDILVLQGIADGLATAIENAHLFEEVQANLEEIQSLHRQYLAQSWIQTLQSKGPLAYTYQKQGHSDTQPVIEAGGEHRTLEVPMSVRGQVIGKIQLKARPGSEPGMEGEWTPEELALVEAVSAQTAISLENARLVEESMLHATQERMVANISSKIWASSNIERILSTALQELGSTLQVTEGEIKLEIEKDSDR